MAKLLSGTRVYGNLIVDTNLTVSGNLTVNGNVVTVGNMTVTGSILPSANVTYDLGSPTLRWRTGYFSANTIDIGGGTIGLHDTLGFTFTTPGAQPQYMMPNGASTSNSFISSTVTIQGNLAVNGNITTIGNVSGQYILGSAQFLTGLTGSGTALTGINSFGNVFIDGQSPVLADNTSDTLTLVSGSGIAITTDAANDSITFSSVSTSEPFKIEGRDFGAVNDPVIVSEDEGSVADGATITYDLGSLISASGLIYPDQLVLPSYPTASLPTASVSAQLVFDSDSTSLKYSDGTNWQLVGSYSNVQVATYLPIYSGNISNIRLGVSGVLTFADGTTQTTAGGGSSYSNVQVASYLTVNPPAGTYSNVQVASYLTVNPPAGTYSNVQVASYLPSYNGNIYARSIGVGTNSFGNVGEIRATNYITSFYSDRRLKTDIVPITNALTKVTQLSGVIYTQNKLAETFGYTDYSQQVGVLAQEVQLVQPEAVKPAPFDIASDGSSISGEHYLTVQYEKLIPLLIEAIKELQSEVVGLKQQIGNANGSNTNRH